MSRPPVLPALWLRDGAELRDRRVTEALLYPLYEFRALLFRRRQGDEALDPFETAVLGACASGVVSITEQADILALDRGFVAHLHQRLRDHGLLDDNGRPGGQVHLVAPQVQEAVTLYWDPFVRSLWPRYVMPSQRLRVSVRGTVLDAGTDGDRYEITIHRVASPPVTPPHALGADEAIDAILAWARDLRRFKRLKAGETLHDPSVSVVGQGDLVFVCCPTPRSDGKRQLQDPFGGALWPPFVRRLNQLAEKRRGLAGWFGQRGRNGDGERPPAHGAIHGLLEQIETLRAQARKGNVPRSHQNQVAIDLWSQAHEIVDHLIGRDTGNTPPLAEDHLVRAASMFGFTLEAAERARLRRAALTPGNDDLFDRCAQLLRCFRPDEPGPLHRVGRVCPTLFSLVNRDTRHSSPNDLAIAVQVVDGLASALTTTDDSGPRQQNGILGVKEQEGSTGSTLGDETVASAEHRATGE